jgi:hypothetical protein
MSKEIERHNRWTKPEIRSLGTIKDVAGNQTPKAQASNAKS